MKITKSLKLPLDKGTQQRLLIEYFETRNEDIRFEILEHNLRLCVKCAVEVCKKYDILDFAEEAFSLCYSELSNSLEKYDPNKKPFSSFSNYACNNMKLRLETHIQRTNIDNSYYVDTTYINDENEYLDIFAELYDESENDIAESIANKEIINNIIKFINNLAPKKKQIMKLYLGIDQPKEFTQLEIHKKLGVSRQYISTIINECYAKIKDFLSKEYPEALPASFKSKYEPKQFNNTAERNNYIINSYYGINNETAKTIQQIAHNTNLTENSVKTLIGKLKKEKTNNADIQNNRIIFRRVATYDNDREKIFNDFYGINNCEIHTWNEIANKYNLPLDSGYVSSLIQQTAHKFIKEGKYTPEEFESIKKERKEKLKERQLHTEYANIYYMHNGLCGYEKKSRHQIAKELMISTTKVDIAIRTYQTHIDSLSEKQF